MPSSSPRRLLPVVLNDFAAGEAAGSPLALTAVLAVVHIALSLTLLLNALPTLFGRRHVAAPA